MASINYNVAGVVTGILGLVIPFLVLFIHFRPRPMLEDLEKELLILENVLGDGQSDSTSDDGVPFQGWDQGQQAFEE